MAKMGFYFDQTSCIGCKACQIACKDKNDLEVGYLFRHVEDFETGAFPSASLYHHSASCNHCVNPKCVEVCPNAAMYVDEADGTVQHDDTKCIGCGYCEQACPYGAPHVIKSLGVSHKCDACYTLRANGEQPACVASCTMRALEFGPYEELAKAHPDAVADIAVLPDSSETSPCTLITPKEAALDANYRRVVM